MQLVKEQAAGLGHRSAVSDLCPFAWGGSLQLLISEPKIAMYALLAIFWGRTYQRCSSRGFSPSQLIDIAHDVCLAKSIL